MGLIFKSSGSDEVGLAEAQERIKELEAQLEQTKNEQKIVEYAQKLGVDAKEYLSKDFNEALVAMVDNFAEKQQNIKDAFEETSSNSAGVGNEKDAESEIKSFAEAIDYISERDGISKADASEKAQVEFKNLFNKLYKKED